MVCFDSEYLHVELYEGPNVLVSQWYGRCTSQQYREALVKFNSYVRLYNVPYAIADRRLLPALSPEDAEWTLNDFLELFSKLPLKRFAILNSFDEDAVVDFTRLSSNKRFPVPFEIQEFEDLTSAYDWLVSVEA
ncbi:hypothetical protein [Pontibacter cellulosilyticus]|uniref:STAS/SEC14 domain-containing protein n=1 Tax=Pontibacter cellulosilyticus TaxID=1720253 RepID=A0A923SKD1_9BACT|nr:hypothetical protein [Pontibacter cellulosilyticus]MBC5994809.1 hypothetical protein [Pontibacter cellulosilyticus]